jgi:perosamine synthetase
MTSMVLINEFRVSRDMLRMKLKERNIDTRPFFPPMSSFPMFKKVNNPVAAYLGDNGINLPSGHRITHEEVKYVCDCIKDILK